MRKAFALVLTAMVAINVLYAQLPKYDNGIASYYADDFEGKKTANGEKYDSTKLTAAHATYPFGTTVEVENIKNNKKVTVVINDRLPKNSSRKIDLSKKAAEKLDFIKDGLAPVRIEVLKFGGETATTVTPATTNAKPKTLTLTNRVVITMTNTVTNRIKKVVTNFVLPSETRYRDRSYSREEYVDDFGDLGDDFIVDEPIDENFQDYNRNNVTGMRPDKKTVVRPDRTTAPKNEVDLYVPTGTKKRTTTTVSPRDDYYAYDRDLEDLIGVGSDATEDSILPYDSGEIVPEAVITNRYSYSGDAGYNDERNRIRTELNAEIKKRSTEPKKQTPVYTEDTVDGSAYYDKNYDRSYYDKYYDKEYDTVAPTYDPRYDDPYYKNPAYEPVDPDVKYTPSTRDSSVYIPSKPDSLIDNSSRIDGGAYVPQDVPSGGYVFAVQVGAFASEANAMSLYNKLRSSGYPVFTTQTAIKGKALIQVKIGYYNSLNKANQIVQELKRYKLAGIVVKATK